MAAGLYDITNEVLGKGHFAVVKLARHCLTSELVAVKIIDKSKLNKEGLIQQSQEVKVLSRLSQHEHPNIVKLYQVIDTKSKLYLVMEYCGRDVCDLYDYIQKKLGGSGLDESEAKHIFRQICSAIAYCHSLRIVHRDLKPENLLILTQPVIDGSSSPVSAPLPSWPKYPIVKLIDFGFANQWVEGTKLKTSCGSLAYSAPEILLGDHYDGDKVDIWGLGCILYILLYGSNPFMQINDNETLCRILDCNFATPARPNISSAAIDLIKALLKKDPHSRLTMVQIMSNKWFADLISNTENNYNYHYPHYSKSRSSPSHHRSNTRSPGIATPSPPMQAPQTPDRRPSLESDQKEAINQTSNKSNSLTRQPLPPTFTQRSVSTSNRSVKSPPSSSSPSPPPTTHSHSFQIPPATSNSNVDSIDGTGSSNASNTEVHDRVIDQMITQKMASSKENIERALKSSRVSSGSNRSSLSSLSNLPVLEEAVVLDSDHHHRQDSLERVVGDASRSRAGSNAGQESEPGGTSDSYISATYNLLKDKILREMQGIPSSSTNVHEIRTSHKRGHILPGRTGRKPGVSQAPRFNRPGTAPISSGPLDEMSLQQKLQESISGTDSMAEEVDDGFILPLQRKCSIVSEEGSVCELSGRLSHSGSDVHTFLIGDGKDPVVVKGPSVDIVITDFSDETAENQESMDLDDNPGTNMVKDQVGDVPEPVDVNDNLEADVDLSSCINEGSSKENESTPPGMMPTSQEESPSSSGTKFIEITQATSMIPIPGQTSLLISGHKHFVSSSPDLSRQVACYGISNIMDMKDLPAIDDVFATGDDVLGVETCRTRTSTMGSNRHESVPVGSYAREGFVRDTYSGRDSGCGYGRDTACFIGKDQVVDDVADSIASSRAGKRRGSKTTSVSSADSAKRGDVVSPPSHNVSGHSSVTDGQQQPGSMVKFQLNKSNAIDPRSGSSGTTSVRVITQSKSCSNILSSAADGGTNNGHASRSGSRKGSRRSHHRNSPKKSSTDSSDGSRSARDAAKDRKNEARTDCCIIC